MNELVITVTCDTTLTYPHNPNGPRPTDPQGLADEYSRAIDAGASIWPIHGSYTNDPVSHPDGRQLQIPIFDGAGPDGSAKTPEYRHRCHGRAPSRSSHPVTLRPHNG